MSDFSNLVRIIHQRRIRGKRLLIDFDATTGQTSAISKEQRLLALVLEKPSRTDLELTKELYGANNLENRAAFRQLRARVQEKLLNHLPFLDYSDNQGLVSRPFETECRTLIYRATLLTSEGETRFSLRLLQRGLRKALEAEFTELAEQAATRLMLLYADALDWSSYAKIYPQVEALRAQKELESRSEELFNSFRETGSKQLIERRESLGNSELLIAELKQLDARVNSYNTFINLYRVELSNAELNGTFEQVLNITKSAQQLYDAGKINRKRFDLRFSYYWIIYAHLRTGQFKEGLQLAEVYAPAFQPASTNWFFFYEHYLLLALHSKRYELAYRLLQQVYGNPSLPKIRQAPAERWELYYAYTMLMQPAGTPPAGRRGLRLPISELTIPEYSRDKTGYNVFILVYQVLLFLRERRLEAVLSRLESLHKYQQRYLKDASLLRSRTFLRLLLLLPEFEFMAGQLTQSERVAQHLATLRHAPLNTTGSSDIEIVPYEHLWDLTLDILRQGPPLETQPGRN